MVSLGSKSPLLLSIDAGSTHCKAAVFDSHGQCLHLAALPTPIRRAQHNRPWIDPQDLWQCVVSLVKETAAQADGSEIAAVGITSMAESGLLVEHSTGSPRTVILPWFDMSSAPQAERLAHTTDPAGRFLVSGIYPSYKCSLAKVLFARDELHAGLEGGIWLSVADYLAYQLSGEYWTDFSLAGRTYAFDIFEKRWDNHYLAELHLSSTLFPPAWAARDPVGRLASAVAAALGLTGGIPVLVAGHDHACAALAAGVIRDGFVLDSIGTAETLCGVMAPGQLGQEELDSGFLFGRHVADDLFYWQSSLSSAGGAVEWLRRLLPVQELGYTELDSLLNQVPSRPGTILFYPYLAGSGAPHEQPEARAAFIGLRSDHNLADLALAVLEGTAYEVEYMRQEAEKLTGREITAVAATGGGVRNSRWMQIRADVTGVPYQLVPTPEAALLGAAMIAGLGAGIYPDCEHAVKAVSTPPEIVYKPNQEMHAQYISIFRAGFMPLQAPLRAYYQKTYGH